MLDYEATSSYTLTVKVDDGFGTDTIDVTINITNDPTDDTPNNPPMFTDGASTTRSITENMPGGTAVGSAISATDSDSGDTLRYSLSGTDAGSFSLNSSTGQLSSSTRFDYETKSSYGVTVTVSDGRGGTDSISVTISVTNDTSDDPTTNSAPTFTDGSSTTRSIAENMTGGTAVGSAISATDSDSGDTLRYSLSGTDAGSFSLNSSTGQLSSSTRFDYETKSSYGVTVTVSDGRGGTDSISVTISVTNDTSDDPISNSAPTFTDGASTTRSITENMPGGTAVGSAISATDSDSGDTLRYSLSGTDAGSFSLNSSTGQLSSSTRFDYETKSSYGVTVTVSDGRGGTDSISVTISVTNDTSDDPTTNSAPTFTDGSSTTRSIAENMTGGTAVGSAISATDSDSGDTLRYSLSGTDAGSFSLNSSTGQLSSSTQFDYETKNSYAVTVTVSDGSGGTDSISVSISVTNDTSDDPVNPPPPPTTSISSRSSSNSNPEPGDTVTFTAGVQQNNNPAIDQTVTFSVSPDDGTASLNPTSATTDSNGQAQTTLTLGSDASGSYTVTATVGTTSTTTTVDVEIPPSPPQQQQQQNQESPPTSDPTPESIPDPTPDPNPQPQPDPDTNQQKSETETQQNTGPNTDTQDPQTVPQPSDPGQSTPDASTPAEPTPEELPRVISKLSVSGQISFSEIMITSEGGLHSRAQWIEVYNNSDTEVVNLKGWHLEIEARDDNGTHRHVVIPLEDLPISANQTVLIATWSGRNSGDFPEDRIYKFFNHHSDEFEQDEHRNMVLGRVGFFLKLSDPDGAVSDVVGNLDGDSKTEDEPAWELPSGTTEDGARTSLMRRYDRDTHVPLDGRISENWVSASALQLSVMTYWGWRTDIGNPGYQGEGALPVTLAHFRAERLDTDVVVIEWTTASELDNAGFNILRSQSKEGPYVKVNQALITGAGTTSERHAYIYRDSGAQPNIAYFYQIEDVSFSGVRQRLATARMRGYVSASDKLTTTWGGLKTRH